MRDNIDTFMRCDIDYSIKYSSPLLDMDLRDSGYDNFDDYDISALNLEY
jgi:hypothetical protein